MKNATRLPYAAKKKDKFVMGEMVKERNESCKMESVALIVAGLRGVDVKEVADAAYGNSTKMFWRDAK